jgi:Domain of unknown function (DUF1844)
MTARCSPVIRLRPEPLLPERDRFRGRVARCAIIDQERVGVTFGVETALPAAYSFPMSMSDDKPGGGKPGFTVNDRRSFAEAPDLPRSAPEPPPVAAAPPVRVAPSSTDALMPDAEGDDPHAGDMGVDFHTFILSLGSSALLHLGELDHPDGAPSEPDLPLAKHTIDIIAMLEQKTKGNLTSPETRLVESLLFDLRLRYVERSKART